MFHPILSAAAAVVSATAVVITAGCAGVLLARCLRRIGMPLLSVHLSIFQNCSLFAVTTLLREKERRTKEESGRKDEKEDKDWRKERR